MNLANNLRARLAAIALVLLACGATAPDGPPSATPPLGSTSDAPEITPAPTEPPPVPTATPINTAALPEASGFGWQPAITGLDRPIVITHAEDNSGRLFIAEKGGLIRVWQAGRLLAEPFLDLTGVTDGSGYEQGLLGLAFHPDYAANGLFFVNYTDRSGDTVIARYQVSGDDPNRADPASALQVLFLDQPFPNHNGGHLAFGPDGYLYIGTGDGGLFNDPSENGQNPNVLFGKMLRLDVDSATPYAIPPDNPYVNGGGLPEIWALGLRNPWRYAFDSLTGDLYIADVGQNEYEEINVVKIGTPGGLNFGWDYREGLHAFEGDPPDGLSFVEPVAEYGRDQGCTVIGGHVYRGEALPEFRGVYLYADLCNGIVWGLLATPTGWENQQLFQLPGNQFSSFGEDEAGEIYLADLNTGTVYILVRQ
ncbi:MAG: glucose dehydrogenase [Anaerolineae bacterium]|nr:MAG: glucose dehydrogenase [Anaerolineae bacterium]